MCGRFTLRAKLNLLLQQFAAETSELEDWPVRYNIAPTQDVLAVRGTDDGKRELVPLRWGLIPSWSKDIKIGSRMINARAETVAEKPAFRSAFKRRRCLILTDGFYEWKKEGKAKQPYHISLQSGKPFAFAGLWEIWKVEGQPTIESCTIITTEPNDLMTNLHDRMPVILSPNDFGPWLDTECDDPKQLLPMLDSYPSNEMRYVAVDKHVNNPRHENQECLTPAKDNET